MLQQSDNQDWEKYVRRAVRSCVCTMRNYTGHPLRQIKCELQHGAWRLMPPERIPPYSEVKFAVTNKGALGGTEGLAIYKAERNDRSVYFRMDWSNPWIGEKICNSKVDCAQQEFQKEYEIEQTFNDRHMMLITWTITDHASQSVVPVIEKTNNNEQTRVFHCKEAIPGDTETRPARLVLGYDDFLLSDQKDNLLASWPYHKIRCTELERNVFSEDAIVIDLGSWDYKKLHLASPKAETIFKLIDYILKKKASQIPHSVTDMIFDVTQHYTIYSNVEVTLEISSQRIKFFREEDKEELHHYSLFDLRSYSAVREGNPRILLDFGELLGLVNKSVILITDEATEIAGAIEQSIRLLSIEKEKNKDLVVF